MAPYNFPLEPSPALGLDPEARAASGSPGFEPGLVVVFAVTLPTAPLRPTYLPKKYRGFTFLDPLQGFFSTCADWRVQILPCSLVKDDAWMRWKDWTCATARWWTVAAAASDCCWRTRILKQTRWGDWAWAP